MAAGFIKLHRKMTEWEWYTDIPTRILFEHCLLKANYKPKKWRGVTVEVGSFITSYEKLAQQTGLTIQQVRTAINKLKSTNEITHKTTSHYSIISINNWVNYQDNNTQDNKQITNNQQTNNKQITTTKNEKNIKNDKNVINSFFNSEKIKKLDPYIDNPIIDKFRTEHKRVFGNKIYLDSGQRQRIMELNADIEGFVETIPETFERLKNIDFDLPNFNPNGAWLLRDNNYTNVLNGLYNGKKKTDIWEELKEKERMRNGTT